MWLAERCDGGEQLRQMQGRGDWLAAAAAATTNV